MQSVTESFRGGRFNRELLKWSGPTPQRFFRLEPEGLRMTLPSQDGPAQPLGIALRPTVRGDFELEATFELLTVALPEKEGRAGLTVYFFMDDQEWNGLWFGKMNDVLRGPVFVTGHAPATGVAARNGSTNSRTRLPHAAGRGPSGSASSAAGPSSASSPPTGKPARSGT